ncbi:MAG: subclass B1 metallo-beta-lactamase [Bacteroidetes bacterium HGW-Bacteroidetes-4]|jgi:metallo-beta-lactamase class B|nr:MAG: subclass B1 metallo-beta-lactamase [Bacteroidetes bacterium HGW-Bacteroidetes-4]
MIKRSILILVFGLTSLIGLPAQPVNTHVIDKDLQLVHLQDSIFVHISWHQLDNFGRFSSNGLLLIKNGQALMIDTPMDNEKTERLTKYLKDSLAVNTTKLIIGHFHDDCLGGLSYLQSRGVESIAHAMTVEKCNEIGLPVPSTPFTDSLTFDFNGEQIDCRYFGAGHSFDNITVWIPGKKMLFGGCLIKSMDARGLGNLSDAVVPVWDSTVTGILKKYPDIKTVIPGHGDYGGAELLVHTIELVGNEKNK